MVSAAYDVIGAELDHHPGRTAVFPMRRQKTVPTHEPGANRFTYQFLADIDEYHEDDGY